MSLLQLLKDLLERGFYDESDSFYLYHQKDLMEEKQNKPRNCMKWCTKEVQGYGGEKYFVCM